MFNASYEFWCWLQSLAKEVLTDYGYKIITTDAKDALNEKRRTSADVILPTALAGKSLADPQTGISMALVVEILPDPKC